MIEAVSLTISAVVLVTVCVGILYFIRVYIIRGTPLIRQEDDYKTMNN
jgi:uncharacterized protein YxeA